MRKALSPIATRRHLALVAEADAHNALVATITDLADYRDARGAGPKDGSLKGIVIQVARRIVAGYGCKIEEMPPAMLRHVQMLKLDMNDALLEMVERRLEYPEMKASLWAMIDRYAQEFHGRAAMGGMR